MGSGFRARHVLGNWIRPVRDDQGPVLSCHQRSRPADEIPHLGAQGAVRLPPAGHRGASEECNRELSLGGPGSQTIKNLQRANVKKISPPRSPECFLSAPAGNSQPTK